MIVQMKSSSNNIEKYLKKKVREIVASKGIDVATRKGSKELNILVKNISYIDFPNQEEAGKVAEQLGEKIVEISQQRNKKFLDKGVVRQIVTAGFVKSLSGSHSSSSAEEPAASTDTPAPVEEAPVAESEPAPTEEKPPESEGDNSQENG